MNPISAALFEYPPALKGNSFPCLFASSDLANFMLFFNATKGLAEMESRLVSLSNEGR
jgi:hypothetical protein